MSNELTIYPPRLGISSSPHLGYGDCRNLDIDSIPGIVQLNFALAKKSASTVVTLPYWIVVNPLVTTESFALDSAGKVYTSVCSS